MTQNRHVAIVGAGPGGLCAGMILARRGFKVSVFEKHGEVGGRNRPIRLGGYTFDTGPTFLMMKFVLDDMFREAGRRLEDYVTTVKLDPMYRLQYDDREILVSSDPEAMRRELRRAFDEGDAGLDAFLEQEERRFHKLYSCIQRDYSSLTRFFSLDLLRAAPYLSLPNSVFKNLGRYFKEEKLRLAFSFQSKYLGMSPWECPALFTMLPFVEHKYGIYHVIGGLNRISEAMAKVIREHGGEIHTDTPVQSLDTDGRTVKGVVLENGERIPADAVVVNADFGYAMSRLVKPGVLKKYSPEKLEKKEFSCSTFMMYLGIKKQYDLPHHNIVFAGDYSGNIRDVFRDKTLSEDFSFYIQNASVSDPSLASAGKSTLYILVPAPNNRSGIDWEKEQEAFRDRVLDAVIHRTGLTDLRDQIEVEKILSPGDWESTENVYRGATFNLSHRFSQLLYWRPRNEFEELKNCYLVGGGTHPGSGLPTIYVSAKLSSDLICRKFGMPPQATEATARPRQSAFESATGPEQPKRKSGSL
ncbi:phytoene desaturase family protein [Methylomagnum sp.]